MSNSINTGILPKTMNHTKNKSTNQPTKGKAFQLGMLISPLRGTINTGKPDLQAVPGLGKSPGEGKG